jgi:hypothetical protein
VELLMDCLLWPCLISLFSGSLLMCCKGFLCGYPVLLLPFCLCS